MLPKTKRFNLKFPLAIHLLMHCWLITAVFLITTPVFSEENSVIQSKVANKLSSRALPTLEFFHGNESGYDLSVSEAANTAIIGVRISEAQTSDVTLTLSYNPLISSAEQPGDFLIPNPDDGTQRNRFNVTIDANKTEASFPLTISPNVLDNKDKVIGFFISGVVGAIAEQEDLRITIRDDENAPILRFTRSDITITEEVTNTLEITIELIGAKNSEPINVTYEFENSIGMNPLGSDTTEVDYIDPSPTLGFLPGQLIIPAESNDFKFNIEFFNDSIAEDQEQLTIKLISADNASISEDRNTFKINVLDGDSTQNKLTDTGVTTCYDQANQPIDCFGPDFPGQDGASFSNRNYVKIGRNGQRVFDNDPWECVYDVDTGLLWEVKPPSEASSDKVSFTWFNPATTVNGGDEGVEGSISTCGFPPCDTDNYVKVLNKENTLGRCGVRKWRVPTVTELLSLVDFQSTDNARNIDVNYFPRTSPFLSVYWTSTPVAVLKGFAWCVDFEKSAIDHVRTCPKQETKLLRLVSTCKLGPTEIDCG